MGLDGRRLTPAGLQEAFRRAYFKRIGEDARNWAMCRSDADAPFMLPKKGKLVPAEVMNAAYDYEPQTDLRERIEEVLAEESKRQPSSGVGVDPQRIALAPEDDTK